MPEVDIAPNESRWKPLRKLGGILNLIQAIMRLQGVFHGKHRCSPLH